MAYLLSQTDKSAIKSIKIEASGEIAEYLDSVETFATVGALKLSLAEQINYINALFVAKERDIEVSSSVAANTSGYKNKVSIKLTTQNGLYSVSGTIFDEEVQRIVEINGFSLDVEPSGHMILFSNSDVPGVIGEVGKLLGDNNINIADFRLGRNKSGALAVIIVDEEVNSDILDKLSKLKAARSVAYVNV